MSGRVEIEPALRAFLERYRSWIARECHLVEAWGPGAEPLRIARMLAYWNMSRITEATQNDWMSIDDAALILTIRAYMPKTWFGWIWIDVEDLLSWGPVRRFVRDTWRRWRHKA